MATFQIFLKKFCDKILYHGNVFSEFSGKETVETFQEKEIHKTRKKKSRLKK